jgi:thermostable 8-oxoguanine DNA glycosylase
MQTMYAVIGDTLRTLQLPPADQQILPGIPWGRFDHMLTPAYWRGQVWQHQQLGTYQNAPLGRSLIEEVAACLLGGFGMKAELGLAAFSRLQSQGLLEKAPSSLQLEAALMEPFFVQGRTWRYRFPRQKARYLAACLAEFSGFSEPADDVALRDRLTGLPGIGLKTASWIVRNYRCSDAVAIIDIHILRAGRYLRIFAPEREPQRHYRDLEREFLRFASAIGAPAAILDGLMWDYMRRLSGLARVAWPNQLTLQFD